MAYASRTLSPAEQRYHLHSGRLEFVALKLAIHERFRDYRYICPHFDVFTDNNAQTCIILPAKLDATRQRRVAELANFSFNFKPGKSNSVADTLSRTLLDLEDLEESYLEVEGSIELIVLASANTWVFMENQEDCTAYCHLVIAIKFWEGK